MLAAKEKTLSDGDALPQAETRVWGLPLENANGTEVLRPASSTLRWGWSALYVGTVSGELDQRYYNANTGSFWTPDPSGMNAVDTKNPNSWNMYAYAGGDPINFNDPDGLAPCSDQWFSYNGRIIGTVSDALNLTKDVTVLAETEFTESGHGSGVNSTAEEDMIGEVIMNRWALVNGYWYLYPNAGKPPQDVSIWGTPGGIANIVQAKGQFDVWDGRLKDSAQTNLDHALNSNFDSKECNDLAWAIGSAIAFISSPTVNLYYDAKTNLAPLAFNFGNLTVPPYMQKIGSFGDANVFYGAPVSDFSANLIPLPGPGQYGHPDHRLLAGRAAAH